MRAAAYEEVYRAEDEVGGGSRELFDVHTRRNAGNISRATSKKLAGQAGRRTLGGWCQGQGA